MSMSSPSAVVGPAPASATTIVEAATGVRVIRWGFLGCGKITHDFINAIKHLPDVELAACAARSLKDAAELAQLFGIKRSYGSYAELVADPHIDVIYVGTLHVSHAEHATLCLNAGKHVLVEKPFAVTARDAEAVFALAKQKSLFCMEAMWSRFTPTHVKLRELLAQGGLGTPMCVDACFGVQMPNNVPRLWTNALAGGALLDLGVYLVSLTANVFGLSGLQEPVRLVAQGDLSVAERVDVHDTLSLSYGPGRMANLSISMLTDMKNEAYIYCSKGWIRLHAPFWCAQTLSYKRAGEEQVTVLHFPHEKRADQANFLFKDSQLMVFEAVEVAACIRAGKVQSDIHSHSDTLHIAQILDESRKQIGVVYAEDRKGTIV